MEERRRMDLRTVITWIVVLAVVLVVAGVGLVYLGAVAKALPTGFGVLSNIDPLVRTLILIVVLAVIAVVAWVLMPKGGAGPRRPGAGAG
jgi:amino acid permease